MQMLWVRIPRIQDSRAYCTNTNKQLVECWNLNAEATGSSQPDISHPAPFDLPSFYGTQEYVAVLALVDCDRR